MPTTNAHGQPVGDPLPGWTARPRPVPVVLEGRRVRLEPLSPDHVDDLHVAVCGDEDGPLWTYRSTGRPRSREELAALVRSDLADPATLTFAVAPTATGRASGLTSYLRMEPAHGCLEIGSILFSRDVQRTPVTTESTHLLLRHAFDDLGHRRVEWKCDSLNEPSRVAARRLGFTYEGRFRHHVTTKGRNRDTDWFAIVESDWAAVRDAHERWLAGLDDDGRQSVSLSELTAPLLA